MLLTGHIMACNRLPIVVHGNLSLTNACTQMLLLESFCCPTYGSLRSISRLWLLSPTSSLTGTKISYCMVPSRLPNSPMHSPRTVGGSSLGIGPPSLCPNFAPKNVGKEGVACVHSRRQDLKCFLSFHRYICMQFIHLIDIHTSVNIHVSVPRSHEDDKCNSACVDM